MVISLSILAALGAMFCWGFGDFFIQKVIRKVGDIETLAWIGFLGSVALLPFVWGDLSLVFQRSNLLILFTLGLVNFAVGLLNFEALKRGKLSVIEVLLEIELPITVLLGLVFFKERLTEMQVFFILAIFIGMLLIALNPKELKKHHFFERGAVLAIITAVGYGIINFLTAVGAKKISPLLTIWFPWVTFSIICILYLYSRGRLASAARHIYRYPWLIIGIGVLDTAAWLLFAIAVQKKELAVTIAIVESYPALSLMLGMSVNKEKLTKLQALGATMTIGGSILIGLIIK